MIYIALIGILLLVGIDQLIKIWAVQALMPSAMPVQLIKFGDTEIINLSYCENTGAAFSIFKDKLPFLIIITSLFILFGLYLIIFKKIKNPAIVYSVALVIAGGIGNLIDRIFRGYVIDYIEIRIFRFAIFNFADCCVVIGAILLLIFTIFFDKQENNKLQEQNNG